jgi:hypothetical protein
MNALDVVMTAFGSSLSLWGYLDPGTGSMVFQVLLAGLLSTAFFVKSWLRYLRGNLLIRQQKR